MDNCKTFVEVIKNHIPTFDNYFKDLCESTLTIGEMKSALFSMKKGKSSGVDGFSVEFYVHFWDLIQSPLLRM